MNDSNARAKTTKLRLLTQKMRNLNLITPSESPDVIKRTNGTNCVEPNGTETLSNTGC